jgi:stringent starvation protein B
MYQWMVDNGMTPHLLVDAASDRVQVPREYVENDRIVLNVDPLAVHGLVLGNDEVDFSARFGGNPTSVVIPVECVLAIYTRENGQGMMFGEEDKQPPSDPNDKPPSRPQLKVVK